METEHPMQYAVITGLQWPESPLVYGSENMSDHELLVYLRQHSEGLKPTAVYKLTHSDLRGSAPLNGVRIERHDKCHICGVPSPCPVLLDRRIRNAFG